MIGVRGRYELLSNDFPLCTMVTFFPGCSAAISPEYMNIRREGLGEMYRREKIMVGVKGDGVGLGIRG
jgi:hypothetical protein